MRLLGSHCRWSNYFPEEKLAFDKVNESTRFDGARYEAAVPSKHERPELPPNRQRSTLAQSIRGLCKMRSWHRLTNQ